MKSTPTPRVPSFRESRTPRPPFGNASVHPHVSPRSMCVSPRLTSVSPRSMMFPHARWVFPHARWVFPYTRWCFHTLDGVSIHSMVFPYTRWCLPKRTRTRGTRSFVVSVDLDMGYILQEILKIYKNFFYFFENFSKKKVLKKIIFLF